MIGLMKIPSTFRGTLQGVSSVREGELSTDTVRLRILPEFVTPDPAMELCGGSFYQEGSCTIEVRKSGYRIDQGRRSVTILSASSSMGGNKWEQVLTIEGRDIPRDAMGTFITMVGEEIEIEVMDATRIQPHHGSPVEPEPAAEPEPPAEEVITPTMPMKEPIAMGQWLLPEEAEAFHKMAETFVASVTAGRGSILESFAQRVREVVIQAIESTDAVELWGCANTLLRVSGNKKHQAWRPIREFAATVRQRLPAEALADEETMAKRLAAMADARVIDDPPLMQPPPRVIVSEAPSEEPEADAEEAVEEEAADEQPDEDLEDPRETDEDPDGYDADADADVPEEAEDAEPVAETGSIAEPVPADAPFKPGDIVWALIDKDEPRIAGVVRRYIAITNEVEIHDLDDEHYIIHEQFVKKPIRLAATNGQPSYALVDMYIEIVASRGKNPSWRYIIDALGNAYRAGLIEKNDNGAWILTKDHVMEAADMTA